MFNVSKKILSTVSAILAMAQVAASCTTDVDADEQSTSALPSQGTNLEVLKSGDNMDVFWNVPRNSLTTKFVNRDNDEYGFRRRKHDDGISVCDDTYMMSVFRNKAIADRLLVGGAVGMSASTILADKGDDASYAGLQTQYHVFENDWIVVCGLDELTPIVLFMNP
jgi:hypothetical protein